MAKKQTKPAHSGIGPLIKALRLKAGAEQRDLAEAADVPLPTLRRWEQGVSDPNWGGVLQLVDAFAEMLGRKAPSVLVDLYLPPAERLPLGPLPIGKPRKETGD